MIGSLNEGILSKKSLSAIGRPHPKTQFTPAEDTKLASIVSTVGEDKWEIVSHMMGTRNPRQCMERWCKYLSPSINRSPFSDEEDALLISKHKELGPKWVKISKFFDNRTDASLKNRWNVLLRRERSNSKHIIKPNVTAQPTKTTVPPVSQVKLETDKKEKETNIFDLSFDSSFFVDPESYLQF